MRTVYELGFGKRRGGLLDAIAEVTAFLGGSDYDLRFHCFVTALARVNGIVGLPVAHGRGRRA